VADDRQNVPNEVLHDNTASRDVMSQPDKQSGGKVYIYSETEQVRAVVIRVIQIWKEGVEVRIVIEDLAEISCEFSSE
jgi:hypothetical protein